MAFKIELSGEVLSDLEDARKFYSEISREFLDRIDKSITITIERIEENSQYFQKRYRDIKIVFTKILSLGIHYSIEESTIYI